MNGQANGRQGMICEACCSSDHANGSPWLGNKNSARLKVLAVDALAVVRAEDGGLEALAVLLQAAALLAVAPLVVACRRALNSNVSPLLHSALCIQVLSEQWQGEQHFIMETLYPAGSAGGDILEIASSVLLTGSLSPAICNPRNDLV